MPTWPATLPQKPEHNGYSETPPNNIIRSNMDVGPDKVRRRTTSDVALATANFVMTLAQVAIFEAFLETDINWGALSYTWDHPRTDVSSTWRIIPPVQINAIGPQLFQVSLSLEKLP